MILRHEPGATRDSRKAAPERLVSRPPPRRAGATTCPNVVGVDLPVADADQELFLRRDLQRLEDAPELVLVLQELAERHRRAVELALEQLLAEPE